MQWFRDEVSKEEDMPEDLLTLLFSHIDPIYELHCSFLKDIEQRMATWQVFGLLLKNRSWYFRKVICKLQFSNTFLPKYFLGKAEEMLT